MGRDKKHTTKKKITNVYSRLSKPLVSFVPIDQEDEEEDTIELDFRPRFMFAPSLCLVCMKLSKITCDSCGMVSYCTNEHKQENTNKHRELCKALTEIFVKDNALSVGKNLSADNYRIYRLKLIGIVEQTIGRVLNLWEREIILYPRVCRICRDCTNIDCCSICYMDYFCSSHKNNHREDSCEGFQVLRRNLFLQHKHGNVKPELPRSLKTKFSGSENFDRLVAGIYKTSMNNYYENMDSYTYSILSNLTTIPLTVLYGIFKSHKNVNDCAELIVHVIGAEFQFECMNFDVWEKLFLHFLPNLKILKLILIGPELNLPDVPRDLLTTVRLCRDCKRLDKNIKIILQPRTLYHEFVRSWKDFENPDIVALFNPGLYRNTGFDGKDTWPMTIREFHRTSAPIIITAYTEHEIPREILRIRSICNDTDVVLEPQRNPFASVKPDRNFVSDEKDPLIYKNYYITIVRKSSLKQV